MARGAAMSEVRNLVLVTVDQWHHAAFSHAGHPVVETPTIDLLARMGTRFTRCFSECPVCIPARNTLMTGTTPRTHGDRVYREGRPAPEAPWLAGCLREAGWQTAAAGKLHVFPQRRRIGFDDVRLHEEGRAQFGVVDDYDTWLAERGFPGQQHAHGLGNNSYEARPWHLPEDCHPTAWTAREFCRLLRRRDPTRPGFWYLSFNGPHPPLAPPAALLDYYRTRPAPEPPTPTWALPAHLTADPHAPCTPAAAAEARRAYWAACAYIDQQLRMVMGTLRDEGLFDTTAILFTGDHGEQLGWHGQWGKWAMYEGSAHVPSILVLPPGHPQARPGAIDARPCGLADVMPTLLGLAGVAVPARVEGRSLLGAPGAIAHSEWGEDARAQRMACDGRWKAVWHAGGNRTQLFDLDTDPDELSDRADDPACAAIRERLMAVIRERLYGTDSTFVRDGVLVGADPLPVPGPARTFGNARGPHWPPMPRR
jgi:arylsulfatase